MTRILSDPEQRHIIHRIKGESLIPIGEHDSGGFVYVAYEIDDMIYALLKHKRSQEISLIYAMDREDYLATFETVPKD